MLARQIGGCIRLISNSRGCARIAQRKLQKNRQVSPHEKSAVFFQYKLSVPQECRRYCTAEDNSEMKSAPKPIVMTSDVTGDQAQPITDQEFEIMMQQLNLNIKAKSKIGGADSIALTLLLHNYCKKHDITLHTATVDHQLRTEAKTEAEMVNEWMTKLGISHHVLELKWPDGKPTSQIQEMARQRRYDLLQSICSKLDAKYLFTGHHMNDQIETFFMRLAHYSNSDGLAGMYRIKKFMNITVVRPLLSMNKRRAIATCMANNQPWVEDPSNTSDKYHRSRVRQGLAALEPDVPAERFISIINDFRKLRDHYHAKIEDFISKHVTSATEYGYVSFNSKDYATLDFNTAYRLLVRLTLHIGGRDYASNFKALRALHLDILSKGKTVSQTLGICWIHSPEQIATTSVLDAIGQNQLTNKKEEGKVIYISRQPSVSSKEKLNINGVTDYMGFWHINVSSRSKDVTLFAISGPLNEKMKQELLASKQYKKIRQKNHVPFKAVLGLPIIIDEKNQLVAAPHYHIYLRKDVRITLSSVPKHALLLGSIEKN